MAALWPDAVVEESNLTKNIWSIRKALGDSEGGGRYIETIPRVGYRFVAPVLAEPLEESKAIALDARSADAAASSPEEEPPDLSKIGATVPPVSERIVHRLEKNPEERFQPARVLAFDLTSVTALSAAAPREGAEGESPRAGEGRSGGFNRRAF